MVNRSKGDERRVHSVQVMHSAEELAVFNALLKARREETDSPDLSPPAVYRWLLMKEARARGIIETPARDIPLDSSPTPVPHSPPAPTTRSRSGHTEPPPAAPDSDPTGPHYRRTPSSKKGGG